MTKEGSTLAEKEEFCNSVRIFLSHRGKEVEKLK